MNRRSRSKTPKSLRAFVDAQPRQKTQNDIAAELGIAPSMLSMYLSGARLPSRDVALKIADKTGIPVESLLRPSLGRTA